MGKASRARSARQAVMEIKREQEAKLQAQKKKKRIATIITSAVCVVLAAVFIASVTFINLGNKNGYFLRKKDALTSANLSMNGATFAYFFNYQYQDFINNNSQYLESYGLDVSESPRFQEMADGTNWFDYMIENTQKNLTEIFLLVEKAKADGLELDEDDKKQIDDFFVDLEESAKKSDQTLENYIYAIYGQGVNADDIRAGLELSTLATKTYDKFIDELEITDDDRNQYFEKNKNKFLAVDYKYYNFVPSITADMTDEQKATVISASKASADKLAKATSPEEFDSILTQLLKDAGQTDAQIKTALEKTIAAETVYDSEFSVSKWAFGEEAKLYGTQLYTSGNNTAVYMLTKLPYKNEGETRSVRHILISSTEETDKEAKKKAEEILAEYNKGEKTGEAFGKLALKYSEDGGSATYGGLYENFSKGTMVEDFEDWSFDASRKEGDTGIVKSTYGYHIMYFEKVGEPVWWANVRAAMQDDAYSELYESLNKKYPVELNKEVLDDIPIIKFKASATTSSAS